MHCDTLVKRFMGAQTYEYKNDTTQVDMDILSWLLSQQVSTQSLLSKKIATGKL